MIYDIINGQEVTKKVINNTPSSRTVPWCPDIMDDALYYYSVVESKKHGKDEDHAKKLYSYIYGGILTKKISTKDISQSGDIIINIRGVDTSVPCLLG